MAKKVLLILGHPAEESFCEALINAYREGALQARAEIKEVWIGELEFNPNLGCGYKNREQMVLEPDLQRMQEWIRWADHLVVVYPTWWGGMPALLKGFIDRIFLPGFAFMHHKGKHFPEQLLKGKTARIIATMDAPAIWFYLVYQQAQYRCMRKQILEYCGIRPARFTTIGWMKKSSTGKRQKWLQHVKILGSKLA